MIKLGSTAISDVRLGTAKIAAVYKGSDLIWQAEPAETGSGTIVYSFDANTRTLAIQQTSASGNDTYSYSPTPQNLDVTTTYEYTVPPA